MRKLMVWVCLLLMTFGTAQAQDDLRLSAGNVPSLTLMAELRSPHVMAFAWSPDSTTLAVAVDSSLVDNNASGLYQVPDAYLGQNILLYETANLTAAPRVLPLEGTIENQLVFSPDGQYLAAAVFERATSLDQLYLWEQRNGTYNPVEIPEDIQAAVIAFSPDSRLLAYLDDDGWPGIWNVAEGRAEPGGQVNIGSSQSIAFSGENEIAFMGMLSNLYLWELGANAARLELSRDLPEGGGGGGERPNLMSVNIERGLIAYHSYDQTVKIADLQTGDVIASLPPQDQAYFKVVFSPRGTLLATIDGGNPISIWDVNAIQQKAAGEPSSQELAATLPVENAMAVLFSPDETMLAVRTVNNPSLQLYSLPGKLPTAEQARNLSNMNVIAYCDSLGPDRPVVRSGDTIGLVWSWYATEPLFVQDHIRAARYTVAIDGNDVTGWTLLTQMENSPENSDYPTVYWYTPLGQTLAAGEHVIGYNLTWQQAISDGLDNYGPDTDMPSESESCTFTVE